MEKENDLEWNLNEVSCPRTELDRVHIFVNTAWGGWLKTFRDMLQGWSYIFLLDTRNTKDYVRYSWMSANITDAI